MFQRVFAAAAVTAACATIPAIAQASTPLAPTGLTTDRQSTPLGLGDARPALAWTLSGEGRDRAQSAYQVQLTQGEQTIWDSGEVHSANSADVAYGGPALASGTKYAWRVRVWDETGQAGDWSAPTTLETGLLSQG